MDTRKRNAAVAVLGVLLVGYLVVEFVRYQRELAYSPGEQQRVWEAELRGKLPAGWELRRFSASNEPRKGFVELAAPGPDGVRYRVQVMFDHQPTWVGRVRDLGEDTEAARVVDFLVTPDGRAQVQYLLGPGTKEWAESVRPLAEEGVRLVRETVR